ncbi:MAG: hypothetical protein LBI33_01540 [Propionibacteriaceae bacterium]|nr:hypothetical protein [Propionibacteriaceae bacterium]
MSPITTSPAGTVISGVADAVAWTNSTVVGPATSPSPGFDSTGAKPWPSTVASTLTVPADRSAAVTAYSDQHSSFPPASTASGHATAAAASPDFTAKGAPLPPILALMATLSAGTLPVFVTANSNRTTSPAAVAPPGPELVTVPFVTNANSAFPTGAAVVGASAGGTLAGADDAPPVGTSAGAAAGTSAGFTSAGGAAVAG